MISLPNCFRIWTYSSAISKARRAIPTAIIPVPARARENIASVRWNARSGDTVSLFHPPSTFVSGTSTSMKNSSEVGKERSPIVWISRLSNGDSRRSITKWRNPAGPWAVSVCASTTATSATLPLLIQVFAPLITQWSPLRSARLRIPDGSEPASGSVVAIHPIRSPCESGATSCRAKSGCALAAISEVAPPIVERADLRVEEFPQAVAEHPLLFVQFEVHELPRQRSAVSLSPFTLFSQGPSSTQG